MSNYEVHARAFFTDVTCPKHRSRMFELKTGLLKEAMWWCNDCDKPYALKPVALRVGTYDKDEAYRQLRSYEK